MYVMGYYIIYNYRKNEMLLFETKKQEIGELNEIIQVEKDKYYMILLI